MIGASSTENFEITGSFASSGNLEAMALTFRCASSIAWLISTSDLNVTITLDFPSNDFDLILSSFSSEETASSTSLVTEFSTSDGAAPGYVVLIVITCFDILGSSSYPIEK